MMERRISVISVNYNGYGLTCAMIDSLRRHVTTPLEIVIVDNGSARDEAAPLRERYPDVKVLRSERNLGFAGGNNLGFAAATGDYLLLLNNDTEVTEDTLHYLCETLDGDRSIGAVCPKIRFFAPPQHIQFAGYTPLTRITLRNALIGFGEPDDGRYDTPHDTPYAHGAAMMVRRETLEKPDRCRRSTSSITRSWTGRYASANRAGASHTIPAARYSTRRARPRANKAPCGATA